MSDGQKAMLAAQRIRRDRERRVAEAEQRELRALRSRRLPLASRDVRIDIDCLLDRAGMEEQWLASVEMRSKPTLSYATAIDRHALAMQRSDEERAQFVRYVGETMGAALVEHMARKWK